MNDHQRNHTIALRIAGVVAILCFVVALPLILGARFHADDFLLFPREQQSWVAAVSGYLTGHDPEAVHYYRPGCRIVQQTLQTTFGTNAVVFHAWNLLLHLAAVYVLYHLAVSITGDRRIGTLAALVFLIHPAHDEPVMWITGISGLTDSLFHLLGLLALDGYLKGQGRRYGWAVVVCFLIAISHKESATSMLLTMPLLWWYRGHNRSRVWPILAVSICVVGLAVWRSVIGVDSDLAWQNLTFNPMAWIRNVIFYLLQFLLPVRSLFRVIGFDNYYKWRDALPVVPSGAAYMAGIALIAVLAIALLRRVWRATPGESKLALGLALLGIAPLLISRYTGMRLLYLSSAFLALSMAVWAGMSRRPKMAMPIIAVWIALLSVSWIERAEAWHMAGQIAERALDSAVEARRMTPDQSASVYLDVPRRHIGAFVFPGAFGAAVEWGSGAGPNRIFDYNNPYTDTTLIPERRIWYRWNEERFEQVASPSQEGN